MQTGLTTKNYYCDKKSELTPIILDIGLTHLHSNKFLRIYITNHLNLTLNYIGKVVANIDYI